MRVKKFNIILHVVFIVSLLVFTFEFDLLFYTCIIQKSLEYKKYFALKNRKGFNVTKIKIDVNKEDLKKSVSYIYIIIYICNLFLGCPENLTMSIVRVVSHYVSKIN